MRLLLPLVVVVVGVIAGCDDCRRIATRPLALDCNTAGGFRGELHLDSVGSWRSFLTDRCLPGAPAADIDALVADIDFTVDAVVVARGDRAVNSRCIASRAAESVDVCGAGLRVLFDDVETNVDECAGGTWTVAVVVSRADLRDALADDAVETDDPASFE